MLIVKTLTLTLVVFCLTLIKADNDEKIVGGQDATQGQFPYQVSWCIDPAITALEYCATICGGSIYNELTIITAAHCCEGVDSGDIGITWGDLRIVAGELDDMAVSGLEQSRKIIGHKTHPNYSPETTGSLKNDVCLLTLDAPLVLNDQVKSISLDTSNPTEGAKCQVSGWGTLTEGGDQPHKLQWVEQSINSDTIVLMPMLILVHSMMQQPCFVLQLQEKIHAKETVVVHLFAMVN